MEEVKKGNFRNDLYYRLNVILIEIPPLRNRNGDITILAKYFVNKYRSVFNKPDVYLSESAFDLMESYSWPANVRELENVIERAVSLAKKNLITPEIRHRHHDVRLNIDQGLFERMSTLSIYEKEIIKKVLLETEFNIAKSSKIFGISRKTLYRKIRLHQLK
jgi:transcriptional regulator with PAS, ATPase and Fis domain